MEIQILEAQIDKYDSSYINILSINYFQLFYIEWKHKITHLIIFGIKIK